MPETIPVELPHGGRGRRGRGVRKENCSRRGVGSQWMPVRFVHGVRGRREEGTASRWCGERRAWILEYCAL